MGESVLRRRRPRKSRRQGIVPRVDGDGPAEAQCSAMSATDPTPTTLVGLFAKTPADQTAIVLPEQNIRITYGQLRDQVAAVAAALAGAGIRRGDRVGMALPNGLPTIVAFLAAGRSGHGRAAQSGLQGRGVPLLPRRHQRQGAAAAGRGRRRRAPRGRRQGAGARRGAWTRPAR